jgi:hypothetical protein
MTSAVATVLALLVLSMVSTLFGPRLLYSSLTFAYQLCISLSVSTRSQLQQPNALT